MTAVAAVSTLAIAPALSLESQRAATVKAGEAARIWFGANYGRRCGTAGPPVFKLISPPTRGELITEEAPYVVPNGQNCAGRSYTGLRIVYKAGSEAGSDVFSYTLEFPHEASNPAPSKGPQPVTVRVMIN